MRSPDRLASATPSQPLVQVAEIPPTCLLAATNRDTQPVKSSGKLVRRLTRYDAHGEAAVEMP